MLNVHPNWHCRWNEHTLGQVVLTSSNRKWIAKRKKQSANDPKCHCQLHNESIKLHEPNIFFFCVPFKFCVHYFWVVWKVNLCRLLVILQVIFNLFFSLRFIYTQSPFVHPSHHLIHLCLNLFDLVLKCTKKSRVIDLSVHTIMCIRQQINE